MPYFTPKINLDAHVNTKINTSTFYKGVSPPHPPIMLNENGGFSFLDQILYTRRVDSPVMMWIQIRARGVLGHAPLFFFFYLNGATWGILGVPKYVIVKLKINIFMDSFPEY